MFPGISIKNRPKPFRIVVKRTEDGGYFSDTACVVNGLVFEDWHAFDRLLHGIGDTRNVHLDVESGDVQLVGCLCENEHLGSLEVVEVK